MCVFNMSTLENAGFSVYQQPPSESGAIWQVVGEDTQMLEIVLPPGGTLYTEPGTMVHMADEIKAKIKVGSCGQCCRRGASGESFIRVAYTNQGQGPQNIGVTRAWPGLIIPINLDVCSGITIADGSYLCNIGDQCKFSVRMARSIGAACCGGQGFLLTSLSGSGMAFLCAMGTVITKTLQPGEVMLADTHSVLAFERTVEYSIRRTGNCKTMCCGGEGLFNTKLTGPGTVWIQSMNLHKMVYAVAGTTIRRMKAQQAAAKANNN